MLRTIGQLARNHNEAMCSGLNVAERAELAVLLEKIATQQGLVPGVHPGYKDLGVSRK